MLRKLVAAVFVLALCFGMVLAEEIPAFITKVQGNKITFAPTKGKERSPEKTMMVVDKVKVVKGKFNKETKKVESTGQEIQGGLKNQMFSSIGEKGIGAVIVTEGDKITEILVKGKGGKKKQQ
jgi:hypothetical protein